MTASQCDRVLAVLRDGDWHDIARSIAAPGRCA
jgi:hypothetical protein